MNKIFLLAFTFVLSTVLYSQPLDISGYKVVQANASLTITLPAGTTIPPGGYVVIARNTTKSVFETFWGTTLSANVTFINGFAVIGGNGFPSINGDETYNLQNASSVSIDGTTIGMVVGQSIKRVSIAGAANLEASWSRTAQTTGNPGSGMTNTNSGKLIISEFSDASAFANEFVELYFDVTPPVSSQGIGSILPTRWKFNQGTQLQIKVKPEADTLRGIRFIKPALFMWDNANISVQPNSAVVTNSGDTTTITNISLSGSDSVNVTITSVTAADTTNDLVIQIHTSINGTSYLPILTQPKTLVYGNPRPMSMVKVKDGGGNHIFLGKWAVVRGIVTVGSEFGGPSFLQDATAAIAIFDSSVTNNINRGDDVILLGLVAPFNNLFEFTPSVLLEKISEGKPIDTLVVTINQIKTQTVDEPLESRLIRVNGIQKVLTSANQPATIWSTSGSGTNYKLIKGTDTLEVRISGRINLVNLPTPFSAFDLVGVLGQFLNNYQIQPRFIDDIIIEGAGPRITTSTPYERNITSTGVTISWTTDSPGSSIVKYGTTSAYGSEKIDTNKVTQHNVVLTGLLPATLYHFQIGTANSVGVTYSPNNLLSTLSQNSTGKINVYFNKSVNFSVAKEESAKVANFSTVLISRINAANFSIDMCAYSFSGTVGANIATALVNAKSRGVKVRVIGEKDNQTTAPWTTLKNVGIVVIDDGYDLINAGNGLMHNKFYVFDYRDKTSDTDDWVIMGSWNATDPGTNNDAQNILEIQDQVLAMAYTLEFEEMWGSNGDSPNQSVSRFGARKLDNTPHRFVVGGVPMELYFSPSDRVTSKINGALSLAASAINVAVLSFTRDELGQTLIAKKVAGRKVRVLMDNNTDSGNEFDILKTAGVDIFLKGSSLGGMLHHKYAIVDAENPSVNNYVVTGSHNWSSAAENTNNENTLIINSKRIANLFLQEFKARYIEAGGKDSIILSVKKTDDDIPASFALFQNYPNPFNPSTTIQFHIANRELVSLTVFDILGREVSMLVNEHLAPGVYSVKWNAAQLSSGVYFYRLQAGNFVQTKKLLLQK